MVTHFTKVNIELTGRQTAVCAIVVRIGIAEYVQRLYKLAGSQVMSKSVRL